MLANSEALVRPIPLHDPFDPPPAPAGGGETRQMETLLRLHSEAHAGAEAAGREDSPEHPAPQQNQSHGTTSCSNRPYPHHVARHFDRCLRIRAAAARRRHRTVPPVSQPPVSLPSAPAPRLTFHPVDSAVRTAKAALKAGSARESDKGRISGRF